MSEQRNNEERRCKRCRQELTSQLYIVRDPRGSLSGAWCEHCLGEILTEEILSSVRGADALSHDQLVALRARAGREAVNALRDGNWSNPFLKSVIDSMGPAVGRMDYITTQLKAV